MLEIGAGPMDEQAIRAAYKSIKARMRSEFENAKDTNVQRQLVADLKSIREAREVLLNDAYENEFYSIVDADADPDADLEKTSVVKPPRPGASTSGTFKKVYRSDSGREITVDLEGDDSAPTPTPAPPRDTRRKPSSKTTRAEPQKFVAKEHSSASNKKLAIAIAAGAGVVLLIIGIIVVPRLTGGSDDSPTPEPGAQQQAAENTTPPTSTATDTSSKSEVAPEPVEPDRPDYPGNRSIEDAFASLKRAHPEIIYPHIDEFIRTEYSSMNAVDLFDVATRFHREVQHAVMTAQKSNTAVAIKTKEYLAHGQANLVRTLFETNASGQAQESLAAIKHVMIARLHLGDNNLDALDNTQVGFSALDPLRDDLSAMLDHLYFVDDANWNDNRQAKQFFEDGQSEWKRARALERLDELTGQSALTGDNRPVILARERYESAEVALSKAIASLAAQRPESRDWLMQRMGR